VVSHLEGSFYHCRDNDITKKQAFCIVELSSNYPPMNIPKAEFIDFFCCHFNNMRVKFVKKRTSFFNCYVKDIETLKAGGVEK
jgi:hypothetical protein